MRFIERDSSRTSIRGRIALPNTPIRVETLATAKNTKSGMKEKKIKTAKEERLQVTLTCLPDSWNPFRMKNANTSYQYLGGTLNKV